ncbi:MAG: hypothetical protein NTV79_02565, partial [Candidatus Aureabacteria bacterium]|nr:hypothetical protein [Candidatus Auribacterota bacterium]
MKTRACLATAVLAIISIGSAEANVPEPQWAKWSQPPYPDEWSGGMNIPSYYYAPEFQPPHNIIVADDWQCTDPRPVTYIRWWGSYPGWKEETSSGPQEPPPTRPIAFRLSWHVYTPPPPYSMPGPLIREEICANFTESWYGV